MTLPFWLEIKFRKEILVVFSVNPSRDHVFHLSFPQEWKSTDISQLFAQFGKSYLLLYEHKINCDGNNQRRTFNCLYDIIWQTIKQKMLSSCNVSVPKLFVHWIVIATCKPCLVWDLWKGKNCPRTFMYTLWYV